MARDALEYDVGGQLRDSQGRPELMVKAKHAALLSTDVSRGYEPADADGRLQMVLVDDSGNDLSLSLVTANSTGGGKSIAPTLLLDSFYDSAVFASKSSAINSAVSAAQALGGTVEFRHARVYSLDAGALSIAPTAALTIKGNKATLKAAWGKPRCIDFTRTTDDCTFQDITIEDLTCDGNSLTAASNQSIIGNMIDGGGTATQRINATRIRLRRVTTLNVPVGGIGGGTNYSSFNLTCNQTASGQTQNNVTDVVLEDCDFTHGGNVGVNISGLGTVTTGLGVNVFFDKISLTRVRHDSGVVPTVTGIGASIQIGGLGFCNRVTATDCYGANSCDIIFEFDAVQNLTVDKCEAVDGFNGKYLVRNFRAPIAVSSQRNTFYSCVAKTISLTRATGGILSNDWLINGDSSTAGFIFGELVLDSCQSLSLTAFAAPGSMQNVGASVNATGIQFRRVTIRGLSIAMPSLAVTSGSNRITLVVLRSLLAGAVYDIDGISWSMAGTSFGAGPASVWRMLILEGSDFHADVKNLSVDLAGFTGMATGATSDSFQFVSPAVNNASTGRLHVNGLRATTAPTNGNYNGVVLPSTATWTPVGTVILEGGDLVKLPNNGPDFNIDATQASSTLIRGIISARTLVRSSGTSITVTASPFTYTNADSVVEDVTVIGGTVTSMSMNGSTIGAAGMYRLQPGDSLVTAYSAAPTMRKFFVIQ